MKMLHAELGNVQTAVQSSLDKIRYMLQLTEEANNEDQSKVQAGYRVALGVTLVERTNVILTKKEVFLANSLIRRYTKLLDEIEFDKNLYQEN